MKARAVTRELLLALEHPPPDLRRRREVGQRVAERLDHDPPVVADLLQRGEGLVPRHLAGPGRAAVVLGGMEVDEHVFAFLQRRTRILLLDVRVEGVVHQPAVRVVDLAHERGCVGGAVDQVHLEAVQVLDDDRHVARRGMLGGCAQALDRVLPLLLRRAGAA